MSDPERLVASCPYTADHEEIFRQAGSLAGPILKGAKPVDLPVEPPIKYQLVLNLKTAKTLGLTIPPAVLALFANH